MLKDFNLYASGLENLPQGRLLITTLNAHSYNVSREDAEFAHALKNSDILLPDGISVVWAAKLLTPKPPKGECKKTLKKIAGEDLFYWEMNRLNNIETRHATSTYKKALFIGSTEEVLAKIRERAGVEFPNVEVHTYSPPYKPEFDDKDNQTMVDIILQVNPDVLFVGMTAPKQEKWAYKLVQSGQLTMDSQKFVVGSNEKSVEIDNGQLTVDNDGNSQKLKIESQESGVESKNTTHYKLPTTNYSLHTNLHICCIGAVFDFYAGTVNRAPRWIIRLGLEWLYRLLKEPKRMWRRYLIGNTKFILSIIKELLTTTK
ncbi:MAG: hypothetical protein RIS29_402 [Bacteroidota bacterium]|jgi:exopolysaccharide biosynthesis WecB/TagA/CpsF family protein